MLKITRSSKKPASRKINGNKSASERNDSNGKTDRFSSDNIEYAKKLRKLKVLKLFKSKTSKSEKLAKSKKLSKIGNFPNFSAKKSGPSFLTSDTKETFNC